MPMRFGIEGNGAAMVAALFAGGLKALHGEFSSLPCSMVLLGGEN
jgi:hypothetical protein